jgi:CRISPR-associated protein Csx14
MIDIPVDVTNPGQFFACCGLLELADRLWPGAEGRFNNQVFELKCACEFAELIDAVAHALLVPEDPEDATASPILIELGDSKLRLDWWHDKRAGGREMKVWAGSMDSVGIARSMQNAMKMSSFQQVGLFDEGMVVRDVDDPTKKKEPFYFDARRAINAHSRDIGFSPNDLDFITIAYPAVEFLCLVGLQRALPCSTDTARLYEYSTWNQWISPSLAPAAVAGLIPQIRANTYRFENWFRTGQRKHKAFRPAVHINKGA